MKERIEKRIAELQQARETHLAQLNAIAGAISELTKLIEPVKEEKPVDESPADQKH